MQLADHRIATRPEDADPLVALAFKAGFRLPGATDAGRPSVFCGMADGPTGLLPQGMMDVVDTAVGRDRPGDGWAPLWAATLDPADRGALDPGIPNDLDRHPDVLVVGGGVMGLATALFCREAGLGRVLVIEADRLASAASGGAGGVLAPDLHQLTDPPAFVDLARSSLALYRQLAQEWDEDDRLLWGAPGLLLFPEGPPSGLRSWPQVELLGTDQVAELVPDLVSVPAALLAREQARLHPPAPSCRPRPPGRQRGHRRGHDQPPGGRRPDRASAHHRR
jgi:hypothetical protein